MIKDLRYLMKEFGIGHSFEYDWRLFDYEIFMNFWAEFAVPMALAFCSCCLVILVITSDIIATLVVALCVLLTDLFLFGLVHYWRLTFNPVTVLQIVLGIGCSVDFSAHIAYAYLVEDVSHLIDKKATKSEIRRKKSEVALGKMGSSVFHGGFSTFLALSVLAPADTYIFIVFYRMWFGILLFGIMNGFLLLPVILSYIGTTETYTDHSHHEEESGDNSERSGKYLDKLSPGYKKGKVTRDIYIASSEVSIS